MKFNLKILKASCNDADHIGDLSFSYNNDLLMHEWVRETCSRLQKSLPKTTVNHFCSNIFTIKKQTKVTYKDAFAFCVTRPMIYSTLNLATILSLPFETPSGLYIAITKEVYDIIIPYLSFMFSAANHVHWSEVQQGLYGTLENLPTEILYDTIIYAIVVRKNYVVSAELQVDGDFIKLTNEFFPFTGDMFLHCVKSHIDLNLKLQRLPHSYTYNRLKDVKLSDEANTLRNCLFNLYEIFYTNYYNLDVQKWHLSNMNPGFVQVYRSLKEAGLAKNEFKKFEAARKALGIKLLEYLRSRHHILTTVNLYS